MRQRWWTFVGTLTHNAAGRLRPAMTLGGRLHARLFALSGGRLGRRFFGADVFVLEVVGRKSGELRETPLLYVRDGANFAILAANAGSDRTPAWWLNLRAAGSATAVFRGKQRVPVTAREAEGEERSRIWDELVRNYPPVGHYETYTARHLPVVVLEPAP